VQDFLLFFFRSSVMNMKRILKYRRLLMSKDYKSAAVVAFILGAGLGAAAALLFAPKSGEDLRSDITDGVNEGISRVHSKGRELKQRAQTVVYIAKDHVQYALDAGDKAYSQAKKA
jgi:gas vesicle protein